MAQASLLVEVLKKTAENVFVAGEGGPPFLNPPRVAYIKIRDCWFAVQVQLSIPSLEQHSPTTY